MEFKEDEDRPSLPFWDATRLLEKGFRVAGEALYPPSSGLPPLVSSGHRRSISEVVAPGHSRSSSFQRLKNSVQKAWRWSGDSRDKRYQPSFNPEVLANQKRQWYQLHSKTTDQIKYKEPTSIFEHFIVVAGLYQDANLEAAEETFAKRKKWELIAKSEMVDFRMFQNWGPAPHTFEPQAWLPERTPSFSDLNALLYGQVLALVARVLLEKQIVVVCPNLVLPVKMLDFLDAPVPFLAEAANQCLTIMRHYMESLCADLRSHTITSIQSNNDRVCLLLKDSYIDSFLVVTDNSLSYL